MQELVYLFLRAGKVATLLMPNIRFANPDRPAMNAVGFLALTPLSLVPFSSVQGHKLLPDE